MTSREMAELCGPRVRELGCEIALGLSPAWWVIYRIPSGPETITLAATFFWPDLEFRNDYAALEALCKKVRNA